MGKIYLNILGLKNFESEDLESLQKELDKIQIDYNSILYEPFKELKRKVFAILQKRQSSKQLWVEFTSYWSGYTSGQRKLVGRHYRKISREMAEKMPKWFSHRFSDNTTNDWSIKIVSVKGKDEGSYSGQIDDFLKSVKPQTPPNPKSA